ncbi:hypothetical protein EKN56_03095 [Limnobaculum zhutongyuii]|uniref:Uncharacterized protein n=1 Tax=Limnobaculum zhutongyuii TaxID=2498113 RepID=A0A411WGQ3_9GAMM|nr:hypothetical protein [Limnobaculum zhutongyuii]QBH95480.1 hypothetical protein EKN56_03095 [Limnobaculum zhutongyuii]TQS88831.1 hypothetical protein ELQ32_09500 [Limnobaculum zhutongyuii]
MSGAILEHFIKAIPELKNRRYLQVFEDAREARIALALSGKPNDKAPLYSRNATYQYIYRKGWYSVTEFDIRAAKLEASQCQ